MKKTTLLFIGLLCTVSFVFCQKNETRLNTSELLAKPNLDFEKVKKHLELQSNYEVEDGDISKQYNLTDEDINIGAEIIQAGLIDKGYKIPSKEVYKSTVENVFGKSLPLCKNLINHEDFSVYLISQKNENIDELRKTEYDYTYDHLFLSEKFGIIFYVSLLDDLFEVKGANIKINIPEKLVARNKYIFNNDKKQLKWLFENDKVFLFQLIDVFGYEKDDALNEVILNDAYKKYSNKIPNQTEKIGSLFFSKNCNGKLQIRKNLLKYVKKNTFSNNNRLIEALTTYMSALYYGDKDNVFKEDPSIIFTEKEKAEIVANIAAIETPAYNKFKEIDPSVWDREGTAFYNLTTAFPKIITIIERNQFFGIPEMEGIIENLAQEAPISPPN